MRNNPSLPSLSCPLWLGLVAPDGLNRTKQWLEFTGVFFAFKLRIYTKLNCLK